MKRRDDPRHKARVEAMQLLFEKSFRKETKVKKDSIAFKVYKNRKKIDELIQKSAPAWPVKQISPADLATLRIAIWELIIKKRKEPYKAIIDEAVEIAKEYGAESSPAFINGVLGTIVHLRHKQ